jgi:exonuclease VII small subunit
MKKSAVNKDTIESFESLEQELQTILSELEDDATPLTERMKLFERSQDVLKLLSVELERQEKNFRSSIQVITQEK